MLGFGETESPPLDNSSGPRPLAAPPLTLLRPRRCVRRALIGGFLALPRCHWLPGPLCSRSQPQPNRAAEVRGRGVCVAAASAPESPQRSSRTLDRAPPTPSMDLETKMKKVSGAGGGRGGLTCARELPRVPDPDPRRCGERTTPLAPNL